MESVRSGRPFLRATACAALASALIAVWIGLGLGGARTTLWVDDCATPLAAAVAFLACLRARARQRGRMRVFWSLLCCATACWTLAEVIWGVYALVLERVVPSPSWADVGYLLAVPLAIAALVVHPATKGNRKRACCAQRAPDAARPRRRDLDPRPAGTGAPPPAPPAPVVRDRSERATAIIVVALTLASTLLAMYDLFLLASGY